MQAQKAYSSLALYPGPKRGPGTHCLCMCRKNNGHSQKSGEFLPIHVAFCWQEWTLWPLLLQKETVDLWFGVFTSAQPPTSECLLAYANFCPVLSRMRTQYPPGPILGPGYEANSSHDGNVQPDEVTEDVLPEILEELKQRFYGTKVKVTEAESLAIVTETTGQSSNDLWMSEREETSNC